VRRIQESEKPIDFLLTLDRQRRAAGDHIAIRTTSQIVYVSTVSIVGIVSAPDQSAPQPATKCPDSEWPPSVTTGPLLMVLMVCWCGFSDDTPHNTKCRANARGQFFYCRADTETLARRGMAAAH
jgi:hypothetical protein